MDELLRIIMNESMKFHLDLQPMNQSEVLMQYHLQVTIELCFFDIFDLLFRFQYFSIDKLRKEPKPKMSIAVSMMPLTMEEYHQLAEIKVEVIFKK